MDSIHVTGSKEVGTQSHTFLNAVATYLGAKAAHIGNGKIAVSQGRFKLTATLIKKQDNRLYAPVRGGMKRLIRESLSCTASYSFEEDGKTLFDFYTDRASFEYEFEK